MKHPQRRSFLQFLGRTGLVVAASPLFAPLEACVSSTSTTKTAATTATPPPFPLRPIAPSTEDKLILTEGLEYKVLIRWDDPISSKDRFGTNNDYLAFIPFNTENPNEGMLWVNHEYHDPLFVSGFAKKTPLTSKTKEQIEKEMYSVGGSLMRIRKKANGDWEVLQDEKFNRRLTAKTMIPFDWHEPIAGKMEAMGTFANCAGGVTPWGTVLTCEENYDNFYGENDYSKDAENPVFTPSVYGWELHYPENKPEHYGWVVEVNPQSGAAKKLVALGRCAHECATVHHCKDGRVVVYTGDDANDECLYKFISSKPNSLREGTLYVANIEKGEWISLKYEDQPLLQKHFKSQTEVLVRLREAAHLVGGSKLNRPEDIEIDPLNGNVLVALTNNVPKGDYLGQILKIVEESPDKTSLKFKSESYLTGAAETGFACPDNMAFDPKGNLWFTSDISGSKIGKGHYKSFGNNGLFFYHAAQNKVIQVASAPNDAEFTGPYFSPDGSTLFLCIQHPGEESKSLEELTSNWPDGAGNIPRSSIVCISGNALTELMNWQEPAAKK